LISVISAIFIGSYFYFTRNFNFWQKLGIPYVKPTPFVGNLKECVLLKTTIGEQLQRIYKEHGDKPYVGIFSFDKPFLLIRDLKLVKNILVKDFHIFMDRTISVEETLEPLFANDLAVLKGQIWRHLRTNLNPVFTSGKLKKMFYLVDTCSKELADCLNRATADGKLFQDKCSYKLHGVITDGNLRTVYESNIYLNHKNILIVHLPFLKLSFYGVLLLKENSRCLHAIRGSHFLLAAGIQAIFVHERLIILSQLILILRI
jgi:hypothetical protein